MQSILSIGSSVALPKVPAGFFDYEYAVLMDGSLALLRTEIDINAQLLQWRRQHSSAFHTPLPRLWEAPARLSTFDGFREGPPIEIETGDAPIVTRLADGRWLLAARRAAPGQANGRLYAESGMPAGRLTIGDGVQHLLCTKDGTIWVGYSDEGIYGDSENGERPVSAAGIAQFSLSGAPLWSFNSRAPDGLWVDDCYAMTLDGNALWACFHSGFPIARIDDGVVRHWANDLTGVNALAIDTDHLLLAGGYDNQETRIALLRLDGEQSRLLATLHFQPPEQGMAGLVQGHDDTLHVVSEGVWTKITVSAVRTFLGI